MAASQARLLALPREIRDNIYSHIPTEYECFAVHMPRMPIRDPIEPVNYTYETPPKYGGVAIDDGIVNEYTHLSPNNRPKWHPLLTVNRQLREEFVEYHQQRSVQPECMRFVVHSLNFDLVIDRVTRYQPSRIVIDISDNYFYGPAMTNNLLRWAHECRTYSDEDMSSVEIAGHRCTLYYRRELRYDKDADMRLGSYRFDQFYRSCVLAQVFHMDIAADPAPGYNTLDLVREHVASISEWFERYDGVDQFKWNVMMELAQQDVEELGKEGKGSGRKRKFGEMEEDEEKERGERGTVKESKALEL